MLFSLAAGACSPHEESPRSEPQNKGAPGSGAPKAAVEASRDSAPPMHLLEQVELAREDVARELGIEAQSVTVLSARPVTWRSSALGCPQAGLNYTQALVPGVHILLRSGDQVTAYHAAVGRAPFRCPPERAETPVYSEESDQL